MIKITHAGIAAAECRKILTQRSAGIVVLTGIVNLEIVRNAIKKALIPEKNEICLSLNC